MFNPDIRDYQLTSIITECCGGVAVVYSALYKPNNQNVAIKRYFVDKTKENANLIQQDIQTRKELQHQNILPYLTSFVHGKELYVVSPLMTYGSCRDVLDHYFQEGLPELACAIILRDVLLALQYLHKQLYIHRSVRASHVLLSPCGARLSGLRRAASLVVRGRRQKHLHSLPPPDADNSNLMWLSPELLEQNLKGYDERSDIYSCGVLCCELANGAVPFADVPSTLMFTEKVRGSRPQLLDCSTFPEPCLDDGEMKNMYTSDVGVGDSADAVCRVRRVYGARKLSDTFHHLSDLALQRDPERRPSATQLLGHAFFRQIRKTDHLPALIGRVKPIKPDPKSLGDGLERVVGDEAHEETRRRIRSAAPGAHLAAGLRGLGLGLLGGVTSLVKHSYEGATQEGLPGFLTGVGKGLVGTVTKPVIGVLDLAAETASALRDTSRRSDKWVPRRVRGPRCAAGAGGLLPRYCAAQAQGVALLYALNNNDYSEQFLAYRIVRDTPHDIRALLSHTFLRICTCKHAAPQVVMETHLSNLVSCSVVGGAGAGAHLVELGVRGGAEGVRRPRVQCDSPELAAWLARHAAHARQLYLEHTHTLLPIADL